MYICLETHTHLIKKYSQEVALASMQEIPRPFWILIFGPWNIFVALYIASFLGKNELNVFQVAIMKLSAVHKYAWEVNIAKRWCLKGSSVSYKIFLLALWL